MKERLNKEKLGNSEPFPETNMPIYLINSEQIGSSEQLCKKFLITKFDCNNGWATGPTWPSSANHCRFCGETTLLNEFRHNSLYLQYRKMVSESNSVIDQHTTNSWRKFEACLIPCRYSSCCFSNKMKWTIFIIAKYNAFHFHFHSIP